MPIVFLFALIISQDAFAYLDPGSGHLIWQYILSVLLGGMFFFSRGIDWVKSTLKRIFGISPKKKEIAEQEKIEA